MSTINLTVEGMIAEVRRIARGLPDPRTGRNTRYDMEDILLGAFSVFFTQSPSFLSTQILMQKAKKKNNARSLFGITNIPTDNQIRSTLDSIQPEHLDTLFDYGHKLLQEIGGLNDYGHPQSLRTTGGDLLIALDGTWYYSSSTIHCGKCSTKKDRKEKTIYYHTMITPVIVTPKKNIAIPLIPEYIVPQDGNEKQDCEITAAKRWLKGRGTQYASLKTTLLGDDLYCHQPMIAAALKQRFNYIFVCKPDSHKSLYAWVEALEQGIDLFTHVVEEWNGKYKEVRTYRYANAIPIRDSDDAIAVNWCEVTITNKKTGKIMYHNAFVTNKQMRAETVEEICRSGRTRWKVENESNNTLKTKGYHLEHNYGHGKQYLASILASLTLIAFLLHTLLDMGCDLYRQLRQELPSRVSFFNDLRAVTTYWPFESWERMFTFMIDGPINGPG